MAPKVKKEKKIAVAVKPVVKVIEKAPVPLKPEEKIKAEQVKAAEVEFGRQSTEKANKDVLVKSAQELHVYISNLKKEAQSASSELEGIHRAIKHGQYEIQAMNFELTRGKEKFEKQNAKAVEELAKRQADVDSSALEYQKLIEETSELKKKLNKELGAIDMERRTLKEAADTSNRLAKDTLAEDRNLRADIEKRENKLQDEIEEFEKLKADMKPKLESISADLNKQKHLTEKLEQEKAQLDRQVAIVASHKKQLDDNELAVRADIENERQKLKNEDARLRQWDQELTDAGLELQAREVKVSQQMKRYQLNETIKSGKAK